MGFGARIRRSPSGFHKPYGSQSFVSTDNRLRFARYCREVPLLCNGVSESDVPQAGFAGEVVGSTTTATYHQMSSRTRLRIRRSTELTLALYRMRVLGEE